MVLADTGAGLEDTAFVGSAGLTGLTGLGGAGLDVDGRFEEELVFLATAKSIKETGFLTLFVVGMAAVCVLVFSVVLASGLLVLGRALSVSVEKSSETLLGNAEVGSFPTIGSSAL